MANDGESKSEPSERLSDPSDELPSALAAELRKRYDIIGPLGAGGMGEVLLARERMLRRLVAIKVMRAKVAQRVESSGRFLEEARIAAGLQHPGILGLLSFDEVNGAYFVMPFVEGETLKGRLEHGPLGEDQALRIVADVADALAYAHTQGIVHRDIKPANILLTGDPERAIVADFGIAKSTTATPLSSIERVEGTPAYMSPEQWAGDREIDERSDLYSLGVMAYELVAGVPPFAGGLSELERQHREQPPTPLVESAPGVSAGYAAAVMRCLAKDRNARWRTAADFANALRATKDDDSDPSELRPLRHVLAYGLLGAAVMGTWGTVMLSAASPDEMPFAVLLALWLFGVAAPLIWAIVVFCRYIRSVKTYSWRDALAVAMRVPSWWHAWWPRRWLSPLERSDKLPVAARRACRWYVGFSTAIVVTLALLGIAINLQFYAFTADEWRGVESSTAWHVFNAITYLWAPLVVAATLLVFAWSWWRARSVIGWVNDPQARRFFEHLRSPATWREPWVHQMIRNTSASQPTLKLSENQ